MASICAKVNSMQSLLDWSTDLAHFWIEHKYIQVTANDKRSLDQNAAIRVCYEQIHKYRDDMEYIEIERQCKLDYGVPLLRRECVIFNDIFKSLEKRYNYEQLLKIMDKFKVTSDDSFSSVMATEMIDIMRKDNPFIVIEKKGR